MPTATTTDGNLAAMAEFSGEPYVVVSTDSHAGPNPERYLRPYCPEQYLAEFDEYCRLARVGADRTIAHVRAGRSGDKTDPTLRELGMEATVRCIECEGHHDPHARLRDMDTSGIAAEVVFAGGQNFEELPFMGKGWNAGVAGFSGELRSAAGSIWNRWLAEYVSVSPERLVGVLQTPVWDVDLAVREVEWGAERGLRVVNLPAPRADFPAYTSLVYEDLWAACDAVGAVLVTHSGGGEEPLGIKERRGGFLHIVENHWLGNRGLAQLIFGGVFHRHPGLRYVLTEQRVEFAPELIRHLDSAYEAGMRTDRTGGGLVPAAPFLYGESDVDPDERSGDALPRHPSDYWRDNCLLSGSFLAPYEVALRHEVGLGNLMWGSDYPHIEGTWPHSRESIRRTFSPVPEGETRLILGETAIGVYGFNRSALVPVAAQIGPTPAEVAVPLTPDEIPLGRGGAFREFGSYA
ncbi:MAG TPA: amidohydrolase family protein [Acidimicrobiales bacterium]|nr:amidohydrolase family protein [Acidimicrobiales bacterium]